MNDVLEKVYREHHQEKKRGGFAILEKERGELFKKWIGENKKVLDLGCRDGTLTKYFINGNKVLGVDIDSDSLDRASKNLGIETVHFNIQNDIWPIKPNSFDVVVAGEVLEHVFFPEKILKKMFEKLKPGGLLIGSVPHAFALKNRIKYLMNNKQGTPLQDPMHINHFSWNEVRELLGGSLREITLYPLGRSYGGFKHSFPQLLAYSIAFKAKK